MQEKVSRVTQMMSLRGKVFLITVGIGEEVGRWVLEVHTGSCDSRRQSGDPAPWSGRCGHMAGRPLGTFFAVFSLAQGAEGRTAADEEGVSGD